MSDELKEGIRHYLMQNLRVEVVNPDYNDYGWPSNPTVKVRILLEGEVVSEDEAPFVHQHGDNR